MDDHEVVLPGEVHHPHEEVAVHAERRRVVREGQDQELGLRPSQPRRLLEPGEEVVTRDQGHRAQVAVGDDHRVGVDRIGRVGDEHPVPRLEDGEGQMGQALLGADRGDRLGFGIELHAVPLAVPGGDGLAQPGDPPGRRVAVVARVPGRLTELVDDVLGRALIRIPHAQVDDVLTLGPRLALQVVDDREDIGGQPLDPVELIHGRVSRRSEDHTAPRVGVSRNPLSGAEIARRRRAPNSGLTRSERALRDPGEGPARESPRPSLGVACEYPRGAFVPGVCYERTWQATQ